MKNLFVLLLLVVFCAQGASVAAGASAFDQSGQLALQDDGFQAAGMLDLDVDDVASDMEEMSDYVAREPGLRASDGRTAPVRLRTPPLVSVDLPRAPPPPRD